VGSIPTHTKLHNNLGQLVHTYVPLSSSSITWYWPKDGDVLWLGRWPQAWWKVMAAYRWDDLRSHVGWLPVHRDQLRAQHSVTSMGELSISLVMRCHISCCSGYCCGMWCSGNHVRNGASQPTLSQLHSLMSDISQLPCVVKDESTLRVNCWMGTMSLWLVSVKQSQPSRLSNRSTLFL